MVPGAFDLDEDGVGVVGKQNTSDQTKHLRSNKPFNSSDSPPLLRNTGRTENLQVGLTPPAMRAESPDPPITQMSEVMM